MSKTTHNSYTYTLAWQHWKSQTLTNLKVKSQSDTERGREKYRVGWALVSRAEQLTNKTSSTRRRSSSSFRLSFHFISHFVVVVVVVDELFFCSVWKSSLLPPWYSIVFTSFKVCHWRSLNILLGNKRRESVYCRKSALGGHIAGSPSSSMLFDGRRHRSILCWMKSIVESCSAFALDNRNKSFIAVVDVSLRIDLSRSNS